MQASVRDCAIGGSLHGALRTYYSYRSRFEQLLYEGPNELFKAFLKLVEIIEATKSFLYMEIEDFFFRKKMKKYILQLLFAGF